MRMDSLAENPEASQRDQRTVMKNGTTRGESLTTDH